jgi:hypothetical protein
MPANIAFLSATTIGESEDCYMKRILAIALTVVMVVSTIGMSGVVAAQEFDGDNCHEAPILNDGQYDLSLTNQEDLKFFQFRLHPNQYMTVTFDVPENVENLRLYTYQETEDFNRYRGVINANLDISSDPYSLNIVIPDSFEEPASFEYWYDADATADARVFCYSLADDELALLNR